MLPHRTTPHNAEPHHTTPHQPQHTTTQHNTPYCKLPIYVYISHTTFHFLHITIQVLDGAIHTYLAPITRPPPIVYYHHCICVCVVHTLSQPTTTHILIRIHPTNVSVSYMQYIQHNTRYRLGTTYNVCHARSTMHVMSTYNVLYIRYVLHPTITSHFLRNATRLASGSA